MIPDFDQGGVPKGVSVGRLFNIPIASKNSGSARSSDS